LRVDRKPEFVIAPDLLVLRHSFFYPQNFHNSLGWKALWDAAHEGTHAMSMILSAAKLAST
jgi:hypothetical protein